MKTDFGSAGESAHHFRVEVAKGVEVRIVEDYGHQIEAVRALLPAATWRAIAQVAKDDFNARLRRMKLPKGHWRKDGPTQLERLLGMELCVLAWAAEPAASEAHAAIAQRWAALRPEERWWLFHKVAEGSSSWRRAIHTALS